MTQEKIRPYEGIDMMHMIKHVAKSWWKMLIAMFIFAVLLGGYSYYKNAKALKTNQKAEQAETVQSEDAGTPSSIKNEEEILADSGLSQKAADEVLYYTNKYYYNKKQYERQIAYLQDSILMQMDPNNVWTITLYYDLSVPAAAENGMGQSSDSAIAASYIAKVSNAETYDLIAGELGADIDSGYFAEVITGSCLDSLSDVEDVTVLSGKEDMKILIRYVDQPGCENIAEIIKERITSVKGDVAGEVGAHQITLVGEREEQKSDPELLNDQKNAIAALGNLSDSVISARTNIEASEEGVFNQLVEYYQMRDEEKETAIQSTAIAENPEESDAEEISQDEEEKQEAVSQAKPHVSKKYVALGMFLGIFLIAAYEACKYFFSHTLKQKKELEEGYRLAVYDSKDKAVITLVMRSKSEKNGWKTIYTASSRRNPAQDEEELQKLMEADAIMLEEKLNVSSHLKIAELLELCKNLEKPVIGAVVEA